MSKHSGEGDSDTAALMDTAFTSPSKLEGSAVRVPNTKGFDSPAKNTRSASRTKDVSNDGSLGDLSDQGDGDTAELMDTSFTSPSKLKGSPGRVPKTRRFDSSAKNT